MKAILKCHVKFLILDMLLVSLGIIFGTIGLIVGIKEKSAFVIIFTLLWAGLSLVLFILDLRKIQWVLVEENKLTVYSLLGKIKQIQMEQITHAFKMNAVVFSLKMTGFYRPCIVICLRKSIKKASVEDAYNRKKQKYMIIADTLENENILKSAYTEQLDQPLEIKEDRRMKL